MLGTGLRWSLQSNLPPARPMGHVELGLKLFFLAGGDAQERPQEGFYYKNFISLLPERFRAAVNGGLPSLNSQHLSLKVQPGIEPVAGIMSNMTSAPARVQHSFTVVPALCQIDAPVGGQQRGLEPQPGIAREPVQLVVEEHRRQRARRPHRARHRQLEHLPHPRQPLRARVKA